MKKNDASSSSTKLNDLQSMRDPLVLKKQTFSYRAKRAIKRAAHPSKNTLLLAPRLIKYALEAVINKSPSLEYWPKTSKLSHLTKKFSSSKSKRPKNKLKHTNYEIESNPERALEILQASYELSPNTRAARQIAELAYKLDFDYSYHEIKRWLAKFINSSHEIDRAKRDKNIEAASRIWFGYAKLLRKDAPEKSIKCMIKAYDLFPDWLYAREIAKLAKSLGRLDLADKMINLLLSSYGQHLTENDQHWISSTRGWISLWKNGFDVGIKSTDRPFTPDAKTILFCLHNSLPEMSSGYAIRSHNLLSSLSNEKYNAVPYTRLGSPWDLRQYREAPQKTDFSKEQDVDGIIYHRNHYPNSGIHEIPISEYMEKNTKHFQSAAIKHKASIVHAASNFYTGLPAIKAARSIGIPCVYEVRGLWEITKISLKPSYRETDYYQLYVRMETEASLYADHVFTLTGALKDELMRRGVSENKITITPNCVDVTRFEPQEKNVELSSKLGLSDKPVIGFIGSLLHYEGIDDLLRAANILKERQLEFYVLLVGDGAAFESLEVLVTELGLQDIVIMAGRVPHDQVIKYYSLIDIAPFPRKPLPVCEMVSPLKPFEAMAMEKTVLVSNVQALSEFIKEGYNGMTFAKGDINDLACKLEILLTNPELRKKIGKDSRKWVKAHRNWSTTTTKVVEVYDSLIERSKLVLT